MDSVRFGRVLGIGARLAAKTVKSAVDAAAAPNPSAAATVGTAAGTTRPAGSSTNTAERPAVRRETEAAPVRTKAAPAAAQARQGLKQGSKRFGEAIWGPFARLGGVLWLEVTGVFFGLMALSVGLGAWKMRAALHATAINHEERVRLLVAIGMAVVFGYFCLSSFVRAGRRGRRR